MRLVVVALALALSCVHVHVPAPRCITPCGVRVQEATASCAEFDATEARCLSALAQPQVVAWDPRFTQACPALKDVYLFQRDGGAWGETNCDFGAVNVGPLPGELCHEYAHAIQRCAPPGGDGRPPTYHLGWAPLYSALRDAGLPP